MNRHPMTDHARRVGYESSEYYVIDRLCDELDKYYAMHEAALTDLADTGVTT